SVQRASAALREGLPNLARAGSLAVLTLAGVSHLDTAWLWTLSETKRKVGRTFSNALALMDRYPDFFFTQSQPQLYRYAKECFPQMYARMKERVAEGRWELIGGAWVENDYNMPGGEAMIRQLLYGKRFFQQEFGRDTNILWAPDTFGYTWALPQIMAHCGMDVFYTSKLSWGDTNEFPYGLFWWQGMDGTRVLAIQDNGAPPARLLPEELIAAWQRFPQRDMTGEFLHTFGYGDGGGGPTEEMIEHARRASGLVGVPRTRFGRVDECIARVKASMGALPVWNDELYFESHRGCQTSQARTKRGNRKMEFLLRDIEQLAALGGDSVVYPQDALQDMWERMLCHQFHDVLPGSSIRQVYVETEEDYQAMIAQATEMRADLLHSLAKRIDTSGEGQAVVVHNTLSWERTDLVEVNIASAAESFNAVSPEGEVGPCQVLSRSDEGCTVLFLAEQVPAMGHTVYRVVPGTTKAEPDCAVTGSSDALENAELRLRFDDRGRLASIFDKQSKREVLAPGTAGNVMQFFDDHPGSLDAWEIDPWFEDRMSEAEPPESVELVECGPLRAKLRHTRRSRHSAITQEISLCWHSRRVDFVTEVDWHERHVLLKCAFPVDVLSPSATFEIQFGAIARPTHRSTSWDRAKFEVPAQRWADLSEDGYGVALLNDCKYGYDVKDNVLRLSLLRAPTDPDPEADQGRHRFTYALYPHIGSWQEAGVVRQGLELNAPLLAVAVQSSGGSLPPIGSALAVDRSHVVLDTLKKAEDGGDLILRLYEAHGRRGKVALRVGLPVAEVSECNGMEVDIGPADFHESVIRFEIKPWQVRAFRLRRSDA
ncbi:MAG: alpha-mannosidase, partial [Armatimonadota bacterium]